MYANAQEAVQKCYLAGEYKPINFTCSLVENTLFIESNESYLAPTLFGCSRRRLFYRDNDDGRRKSWAYKMVRPDSINKIGIAGSNPAGDVGLVILNFMKELNRMFTGKK